MEWQSQAQTHEQKYLGTAALIVLKKRLSTWRKLRESSRPGDEIHANAQLYSVPIHSHLSCCSIQALSYILDSNSTALVNVSDLLAHVLSPILSFSLSPILFGRQEKNKPNPFQRCTFKTPSMLKPFSPRICHRFCIRCRLTDLSPDF